ncbi:hypothetical protein Taro_030029 [Colocasia esculenta]|uniref:MULE transposase domain-containing protein n=1 Tax=Colocasia esculenta TaxID=4460 RepID=A0A843VQS3_COLES|nr:hypothetical protein [Colocasia esculenta]
MELTNYEITQGFNWKYLKNDSTRLTVRCNVDVCPWHLHASIIREGPKFAIKGLNNIYSCGCDIMSDRHPRTSKKWVANTVKGKLVEEPTYRASAMMRYIRRDYGISIPYHQAWCGKEDAVSSLCGDFRTSYHILHWYNELALQSNPESKWTRRQCFKRFFICFQTSAYGFKVGCRPMLFFDGTHIKQHRVQGVILAASALNSNNELFTIAYSIADLETYDNWVWFLQNLKRALLSDRRIAFLSDKGKGLKEANPDIFPNDHYGYCFQHIMQNFNDQCAGKYASPFKKLLRKILQRIAYAITEQEYQDAMIAMELNSADAKEWVLQNDVDLWSHAHFPGQRFGELHSTLAESFNNWINDARSLPILQMVDKIKDQMMEMAAKRKIDAALWDTPYCPKVQKIIEKNLQERRSLAICRSDRIKFEVIESIKTYAIPYKHACAAIGSNKEAVSQYVSAFYSTEVYRAAYKTNIQLILTFDMPDPPQPSDVLIKPPTTKRLPG